MSYVIFFKLDHCYNYKWTLMMSPLVSENILVHGSRVNLIFWRTPQEMSH